MKRKIVTFIRGVKERAAKLLQRNEVKISLAMLLIIVAGIQDLCAQDIGAGQNAIGIVTDNIKGYVGPVRNLLYAIAGVVGLGGVITIFVKMNNEENDIKKTIMLVLGSCVTLIALAEAIPAFFGLK